MLDITVLVLDFMVNQKFTSQEFLYVQLFHIAAPRCTILNTQLTFLKLMLKMKITTPSALPRFPTTSEVFLLKITR